jgi:hypothetical protein
MKRSFSFSLVLASLLIASCGGGGSDNSILDPRGGTLVTPEATSIQLLASSPQFPSDQTGLETIQLTAIARDENNNAIEGVAILMSAVGDPFAAISNYSDPDRVTDVNGIITADLSNGVGGAQNRTIRVTAQDTRSGISASINIAVVGTTLTIEGASALAENDSAEYVVVLSDSQGVGISGQTVAVSSANGNAIAAPSLVTDGTGKVTFTLTATQAGGDTITVSAFGETALRPLTVSNDQFTLAHSPTAGADIPLGPAETVTLTWSVGGTPQAGQTINFTATRGTLSAATAVTDGAGQASVTIMSNTAGPSVVTASNAAGTSTTLPLEFVATNPTQISVQASPFTVGPGQSSEIVAVVRDVDDNLVKNQLVNFLILSDDSNGFLTVASATTDGQGKATTFYTGGQVQGASNGVVISATVAGTAITANVNLTVARQEFDFIIGTGNELFEPTTATYAQEWNIIVTDSVGNSVQNTPIQVSLRSLEYAEGNLRVDVNLGQWVYDDTVVPPAPLWCPDEDVNRNGILEPAEDLNGSGQMEAGNVATVAPVPDSAPPDDPCTTAGAGGTETDVLTNSQGIARVCVIWPQNFAWWVRAQIQAQSTVSGSESSQAQSFVLPALADDINDITSSPPNVVSPFGEDRVCATPPPGLPL